MSKHWKPEVVKGARPRGRGRWRPHRRRRRPVGIGWAELRLVLTIGLACGLGFASLAEEEAPVAFAGAAAAIQVIDPWEAEVVDGDTFDYGGERIRIADIDTPEVRGECGYEVRLAAQATERMEGLLHEAPFEMQPIPGRDEDQYGRKLRVIVRDGRSLGDQLVSEGLARTWEGRRRPWCG